MPQLKIAKNLNLPVEAVTQTFAILAKRGVGKTYTAAVLTEELLKAGLHAVIVDPIGVWWGLRASADGTRAGLPIIVLGGDRGDVPLEVTAGETIADVVVQEGLSVVLDLSGFRKGEQTKFMTDFCERLYHRNREPLHLVLDEADAFAPQRPMKGQERLLGAVKDLILNHQRQRDRLITQLREVIERAAAEDGTLAPAIIDWSQQAIELPKLPAQPKRPSAPAPVATAENSLSGGERKILTALAQYSSGRSKTQLAILTGYSHKGGGFNNYLSALRSKGYITGTTEHIKISAAGLDALGSYDPLPSGEALIDYWRRQLWKAERAILDALIAAYPASMFKDEVALLTGYEANGGGFNNALSKLRTLELIEGRGELKAADTFFAG